MVCSDLGNFGIELVKSTIKHLALLLPLVYQVFNLSVTLGFNIINTLLELLNQIILDLLNRFLLNLLSHTHGVFSCLGNFS